MALVSSFGLVLCFVFLFDHAIFAYSNQSIHNQRKTIVKSFRLATGVGHEVYLKIC